MENLKRLYDICKSGVFIDYNRHRNYYETVEEYVTDWGNGEMRQEIPDHVFNEMVKRDTVVFVQFYPNTPIGFFTVWHYDIEAAIEIALQMLIDQPT